MAEAQPPLTWQTSAQSQPQQSSALPSEVVTCLENARFVRPALSTLPSETHDICGPCPCPCPAYTNVCPKLHLATCTDNQPHVSLMNYTYLPSSPFTSNPTLANPTIIMTTNPSSKKTINLLSNPSVSLLVHDWVSHRPPTNARSISPDGRRNPAARSSLASLLMGMNTSEMGSISATINGEAEVLEQGSDEEKWCKRQHLENNTFEDHPMGAVGDDGGAAAFVEDEDVRVVVVRIREGRIADWKGGVKDWVLTPSSSAPHRGESLVNGL